jgi:hypothetical protein
LVNNPSWEGTMTKKISNRLTWVIPVFLGIVLQGCTAVMFTLGAISDSASPKEKTIPGWQIGSISNGSEACVFMNNADSASAKYLGLAKYSPPDYKRLFEDSKSRNIKTPFFLELDQKVAVYSGYKTRDDITFRGFEYEYTKNHRISQSMESSKSYIMLGSSLQKEIPVKIPLSNINMVVSQNGDTLKGGNIRALLSSGQLPTDNFVKLTAASQAITIQVANIDSLRVHISNRSKWGYTALGVVVDAIVALTLATSTFF